MTPPTTLGTRLRQARRERAAREGRDVTQGDVGADAGVTAAQVSRYESDLQEPSIGVVYRLAAALGVAPGWLAFGDEADAVGQRMPVSAPAVRDAKLAALKTQADARKKAPRRESRRGA